MKHSEKPYHIEIVIDGLPELNTAASRRHRLAQHRDAQHWKKTVMSGVHLVGKPRRLLRRAEVIATRHSCIVLPPDPDNLAWSFKSMIDAFLPSKLQKTLQRGRQTWVVRGGADVILDDNAKVLERVYRHEQGPRGQGFVSLELRELR